MCAASSPAPSPRGVGGVWGVCVCAASSPSPSPRGVGGVWGVCAATAVSPVVYELCRRRGKLSPGGLHPSVDPIPSATAVAPVVYELRRRRGKLSPGALHPSVDPIPAATAVAPVLQKPIKKLPDFATSVFFLGFQKPIKNFRILRPRTLSASALPGSENLRNCAAPALSPSLAQKISETALRSPSALRGPQNLRNCAALSRPPSLRPCLRNSQELRCSLPLSLCPPWLRKSQKLHCSLPPSLSPSLAQKL